MNDVLIEILAKQILNIFPVTGRNIQGIRKARIKTILSQIEFMKPITLANQILSRISSKVDRKQARNEIIRLINYTKDSDLFTLKEVFIKAQTNTERILKHLKAEIDRNSNSNELEFMDTLLDDANHSLFQCVEKLKHYREHKGKNSKPSKY